MERIPEPDLMEDDAQARAYAEADFEEAHQNFITFFQEQWPGRNVTGRVLDLGCGPADISIRFARAFPDCVIEGVDGAEAMLAYGHKAIAAAGFSERIELRRCYLPNDALMMQQYDAVISNSLLHHLNDPVTLWQAVKGCTEGNGDTPVFVVDLMRPQSEGEAKRYVDYYAGDEPEVLQHDFYHSLLAAYTVDEVREQLKMAGLDERLEVKAMTSLHLAVMGLL